MKKYIVLIADGMADRPLKQLGGKTPLEAAETPNLDFLAQNGICGWTNNTPKPLEPGSDVAAMSIFGYDPLKQYSGRGPLEAASLGVKLRAGEVAFRCNLVTIDHGIMKDFTANHISTEEAKRIFYRLNQVCGSDEVKFYPGLSYRNLLVVKSKAQSPLAKVRTKAPHDIIGQHISQFLPRGEGSEALLQLMNQAEVLLQQMGSQATLIWPWGQGVLPEVEPFRRRFHKRGAIITAVHLLKGLGKILGMEVINVPGATGYLDTNYVGKAKYAIKALKHNDIVFVHIEAPDEAGHEGNIKHKIQAIEDFDRLVLGTILAQLKSAKVDVKLMVLPDHPTPISLKTHSSDNVPFVIYPSPLVGHGRRVNKFSEKEVKKSQLKKLPGHKLLKYFLE